MAKSRGITTFSLALSITILMITACESQHEKTAVTEPSPSPTPMFSTSPSPGASPTYSPGVTPTNGASAKLTPYDREFLSDAARGSALEVQLGNFAAQKAASEEVKRFGQQLAADHSRGGQTIRQMASNLKFTLPQELTPEQRNLVSRLENLSGKNFDREYIKAMVTDHMNDISEYERAAAQATIPEIKQFASQALPMLRDHLKLAREIAAKQGVKVE